MPSTVDLRSVADVEAGLLEEAVADDGLAGPGQRPALLHAGSRRRRRRRR